MHSFSEGAATAFWLQQRIFYLYFINFDHTENFMTTQLNVISVNFVKSQSRHDVRLKYISATCGDAEGGINGCSQ